MDLDLALEQTLSLLGGRLRDAGGATLGAATAVPLLLDDTVDASEAARVLSAGQRVAIVVGPSGQGPLRVLSWLAQRRGLAAARRRLTRLGATRVRAIAVVPGRESLFLLYELDGRARAYAESHLLIGAVPAAWVRMVKSVLRLAAGVDIAAEFVIVVGERA